MSASQPTHGDLDRSIGRLEGIIGQMLDSRKQRDDHVDDRLARIEAKLDGLDRKITKAEGGWKTLIAIGGIGGVIGGWVVPAFIKRMMGW